MAAGKFRGLIYRISDEVKKILSPNSNLSEYHIVSGEKFFRIKYEDLKDRTFEDETVVSFDATDVEGLDCWAYNIELSR